MVVNLGKLLRKQNPRRLLSPSELTDIILGADVKEKDGTERYVPGLPQLMDSHSELLNIHNMAFAGLARYLKISAEDFSKFCSEINENMVYLQKTREIEVARANAEKEKNKQEAIEDAKEEVKTA